MFRQFLAARPCFAAQIFTIAVAVLIIVAFAPAGAEAEAIKIGVLKVTGAAPVFAAQEKG